MFYTNLNFKKLLFLFIGLLLIKSIFAQFSAGNIDPNAIKIELSEFDKMEDFHNGFAVIRKGQSSAIINRKGEFLVPFNKYKGIEKFINGYCLVYDGDIFGSGIIDKEGKEVIPCIYYF